MQDTVLSSVGCGVNPKKIFTESLGFKDKTARTNKPFHLHFPLYNIYSCIPTLNSKMLTTVFFPESPQLL